MKGNGALLGIVVLYVCLQQTIGLYIFHIITLFFFLVYHKTVFTIYGFKKTNC